MRRFLALAVICALGSVAMGAAAVFLALTDSDTGRDVSSPASREATTSTTRRVAPTTEPERRGPTTTARRGAPLKVTGRVTSISGEEADAAPVPGPFTVDVPARGEGKATIVQATVGGKPSTIAWDGGRPLVLDGGELVIGIARFSASGGTGLRFLLDGEPRRLTEATWLTKTPVAVGDEGLAKPREGVTFKAGLQTLLQTKGGAYVELPVGSASVTGAGSVHIEGDFMIGGKRRKVVDVAAVSYRFTLVPVNGGYDVTGEIIEPSR